MLFPIVVWFIITSLLVRSDDNLSSFGRIYSNQAEIIQSLGKLPLEFSNEDWNNIRSDSFTLLGQNVNITSQTITEKHHSLNGAKVYVRSPMSFDQNVLNLVKGILIDEDRNLVKIEDGSMDDGQTLYFTVKPDQLFYLEEPVKSKFYVNFTYNASDSPVSVSYLRTNLHWQTQYQLNLNNDDCILIAIANIQNNGKTVLAINRAELIGGDINLHERQNLLMSYSLDRARVINARDESYESMTTIEQGTELAGLYVFPINRPFVIDAQTNYLLPMFRPSITVERFGLISKVFSTKSNGGQVQRSYRLKSDRFLSRGDCIVRELDRIVGETTLPNIAASDKYQFSVGYDADVVYKEKVRLISSTTFTEEIVTENHQFETSSGRTLHTRRRSIYQINLQIKNFKSRPISIVYEQSDSYQYQNVKLMISDNQPFYQEASSIKASMTLNANDVQMYSYSVELVL